MIIDSEDLKEKIKRDYNKIRIDVEENEILTNSDKEAIISSLETQRKIRLETIEHF